MIEYIKEFQKKIKSELKINLKENSNFSLLVILSIIIGLLAVIVPDSRYLLRLWNYFNFKKNPWHIINLILIGIFVFFVFIFFEDNSDMIKATKMGLYATIVAFCAYLQLPFIPFWITHFFIYFNIDK